MTLLLPDIIIWVNADYACLGLNTGNADQTRLGLAQVPLTMPAWAWSE